MSGRSGVFWPGGGPATLLGHSWPAHFSRRRSLRLLFSILIKSLPFTFYDLHVVAMPERRCAYYYRAMILLCRASSSPSPSRFYSLDMTRVISYTVDEVFRSCFFLFSLDARDQLGIRSYTNHCGGYFTMYFYSHRPWKITTSTYVQQHFSCFCLYSWLFFSIKHVRTGYGPCYSRARSLSNTQSDPRRRKIVC